METTIISLSPMTNPSKACFWTFYVADVSCLSVFPCRSSRRAVKCPSRDRLNKKCAKECTLSQKLASYNRHLEQPPVVSDRTVSIFGALILKICMRNRIRIN